jgi:hypothetical protein
VLISNELGDKIADVSFLDARGVDNIKYPYFLLKKLGIPFTTIVDKDYFLNTRMMKYLKVEILKLDYLITNQN